MYDMEMQRQEKIMKDQAKRDAARVSREESKAAKKETDMARVERHNAFREELKQTLVSVSNRNCLLGIVCLFFFFGKSLLFRKS